jgi:hypothetical protein
MKTKLVSKDEKTLFEHSLDESISRPFVAIFLGTSAKIRTVSVLFDAHKGSGSLRSGFVPKCHEIIRQLLPLPSENVLPRRALPHKHFPEECLPNVKGILTVLRDFFPRNQ